MVTKLSKIHNERSPRAKSSDEKQKHKNIIKPTDTEAVKQWIKDPGTADIVGVDTPERTSAIVRRVVKKRKAKRFQTARGIAQDKRQSNKDKITRTSPVSRPGKRILAAWMLGE